MAAPQPSTAYFSASENVEIFQLQRRDRSVVEGSSSSCCCRPYPIIKGHIKGCLGETFIKMNLCNAYKEEDLENWTKSAKVKIWKAATDADRQSLDTDSTALDTATFFNKNSLILSWMDSKSLNRIGDVSPKVNLVFHFGCLGDDLVGWEKWAREQNVLLVHQDPLIFNAEAPQDMKRRSFGDVCKDTINTLMLPSVQPDM